MSELLAQLREWRDAAGRLVPPWWGKALAGLLVAVGVVLPFLTGSSSGFLNGTIVAVAYAVMPLLGMPALHVSGLLAALLVRIARTAADLPAAQVRSWGVLIVLCVLAAAGWTVARSRTLTAPL